MFVLKLLALILMFIILIPVSKDIAETFTNIDPELYNRHNSMVRNFVNSDILQHSIKMCNKKIESELNCALCKHKPCLNDAIKYIEGVNWSVWNNPTKQLEDINYQMYLYVADKLDADIIYFELKQYKKNLKNAKELLLHFEFVLYKKNSVYAYHISYITVYNIDTQSFNILNVRILGSISEDKIHMYQNQNNSIDYSPIKLDIKYMESLVVEDPYEAITTHDEQVENILYHKLLNKDEFSDDYWKNIEYTNNQNIVRNMFLQDKHQQKPMPSCYKKYPYGNDFTISS